MVCRQVVHSQNGKSLATMRCLPFPGLLILAACGGGAYAPPDVRDSLGVTIVENYGPQWQRAERWRLSAEPVVDIGGEGADESHTISRPIGAVRLDDGSIVVANGGTQELRWYDSNGWHLRTVGGRGVGTGHFASLDWVGTAPSGSLAAFDFGRLRLSLYTPAGELEQAVSLVITFQMEPGSVRGILSDSTLVLIRDARHWAQSMSRAGATPEGLARGPASVSRYAIDGRFLADVGTFPGAERIFAKGRSRIVRITGRPFGRDAVFAVTSDGLYVGTQDSYEIEFRTPTGELRSIVRLVRDNDPVTEDHTDRYKRGRLANVHEREREAKEQELAQLPFPETMPAYGPISVDADGNLWVAEFLPFGADEVMWNVFDPEHRLLGAVGLPGGFAVYDIGADYILGAATDEQGARRIRLYSLEKPREAN
jgi:hypothetical protein